MKIPSADNPVPTKASCCKQGVDQIRDCLLSVIPSADNPVPTKASCCKQGVDQIRDCLLSVIPSVDNPVPTKASCKQGVDQIRNCLLSSILPHWLTDWLNEPHLHPDFKHRSAWHDLGSWLVVMDQISKSSAMSSMLPMSKCADWIQVLLTGVCLIEEWNLLLVMTCMS